MKTDKGLQIPNHFVYIALYAIVFGTSIWVLIVDKESPHNWIPYAAMIVAVLAGLAKFIIHLRKQPQETM